MGLAYRIQRVASFAFIFLLVACGPSSTNNDVTDSPTSPIEVERNRTQELNIASEESTAIPSPVEEVGQVLSSPPVDAANLDADGDGWLTADEFQIDLFNSSSGYNFSPEFPMSGEQAWINFTAGNPDQAQGAEYQIGLADMMLGVYFECSWMLTWIDAFATGDNQRQNEALSQLERMLELGYFEDQASRDAVASILGQAQLGDPAGLQQLVNVNCQGIKWAN